MHSFGGAFSKTEKIPEPVHTACGWACADQYNFKPGRKDYCYSPLTVLPTSTHKHLLVWSSWNVRWFTLLWNITSVLEKMPIYRTMCCVLQITSLDSTTMCSKSYWQGTTAKGTSEPKLFIWHAFIIYFVCWSPMEFCICTLPQEVRILHFRNV